MNETFAMSMESSSSPEIHLRREVEHLKQKLEQTREKVESLNEKLEKAWDDKIGLRQNVIIMFFYNFNLLGRDSKCSS